MRHLLLWGTALSVICLSTSCRRQPAASTPGTTKTVETGPATAASNPTTAGLQVTPIGAGHNEVAEILGLQMWRFHIVCDAPGALISHTITLRQNGQWVKEVSGGLCRWSDGGDKQMIVALYPLDGDLNTSDKLKTYVRIGGTKSTSIGDNPMKGQHAITTLSVANRQDDGSFLLMQASGGRSDPAEDQTHLVLRIYISGMEDTPPDA